MATGFGLCPLVAVFAAVEAVKIELALSAIVNRMDGAPLTAVFVRKLVPVGTHVATNLAACRDIAKELGAAIGEGGKRKSRRGKRKSQGLRSN